VSTEPATDDVPQPHPDEPGTSRATQRRTNYAAAIYGLILVDSVLAVYREEASSVGADTVAATVLVTALVFWLAHVYAELLAFRIEEGRSPTWADAKQAMRYQWPIVNATGLPLLALLLGVVGLIPDKAAVTLALIVCFVELGGLGLESARRGGATGAVAWLSGAIALLLGVVVVGLKVIVQH
jgi:hypothetical protein